MQAYRDNFKQTPCPTNLDQSVVSTSARLPFSKGQHNRTVSDHHLPASAAVNVTTPRMLSPTVSHEGGTSTSALLRQNQELRQRLADEANNYRRRLDTYKQAQQNQATLVSRLQSKIQQYRQRCSDLEERMHETIKPSTTCHMPKLTTGPTSSQVVVGIRKISNYLIYLLRCLMISVRNFFDFRPLESTVFLFFRDNTAFSTHL